MGGGVEDAMYWKRKSERSIEAARLLFKNGFYPEAVSRAYYAIIYLIKALFARDGIHAYKPATMLVALGQNYVVPGKLGASFHRSIMQIFDERYNADFEPRSVVDFETAEQMLQLAEELQEEIFCMLKSVMKEENVS